MIWPAQWGAITAAERARHWSISRLWDTGASGSSGFPNSAKYQTYWQTLDRLDLSYKPQWVHFFQLPDLAPGIVAGYHAMQTLLSTPGPRPTAILATNDLVAMGAMEALNLAGIPVPGQISVIGYDDLDGSTRVGLTPFDPSRKRSGAQRPPCSWIDWRGNPRQSASQ